MRNARAFSLAIAALAAVGCITPAPGPVFGGGPTTPGTLEQSARRRLFDAERTLRAEIAAGMLSPEALDELHGRAAVILASARRAEADGRVTDQERLEVEQLLSDSFDRGEQRIAMPRAWSGGPAYWR